MLKPVIASVKGSTSLGLLSRLFHVSLKQEAINKAQLSKLRKKTGFPFVKCKNALEKFDNNLDQAESWLKEQAQKEGWAKATKLQGRAMSQGLIGLMVDRDRSAMVEINCETDFVARNDKFQNLVFTVTNACMNWGKQRSESKIYLGSSAVKAIPSSEGKTLADLLAMEIGNIGENMDIRRAVLFKAGDQKKIGSYVHSVGSHKEKSAKCATGKFAAVTVFSQEMAAPEGKQSAQEVGRQLCQHIVGMNPKTLGSASDLIEEEEETSNSESSSDESSSSDEDSPPEKEESVMLKQEFLLDSTVKVHEFLKENSVTVYDFVRFECGETLEVEEEPKSVDTSQENAS